MDFLVQLLAAVGGALGIVLILMRMGKSFIEKWVETNIETTAEKSLSQYTNLLEQRTKAYELILEKEFEYFQCAANFMSNLVLDIQAFPDYFSYCNGGFNEENYQRTKSISMKITSNAEIFTRNIILAQSFIPEEMYSTSLELVRNLKYALYQLNAALEMSRETLLPENVIEPAFDCQENIVKDCGKLSAKIKERLEELSKE